MRRARLLLGALAIVASLVLAPVASAADGIAPPGAPENWLPKWGWVLDHWFPYDTGTLYRALRTNDQELRRYFGGQRHEVVPPLMGLARARGWHRRQLVRMLMKPWRGQVSRRHFRQLARRSTLTLTQGHLMQHMLFHPLHERALARRQSEIFGASAVDVSSLLRQGLSRYSVGSTFGRTGHQMTDAADRILDQRATAGIRHRWTPRRQMRRYLRLQRSQVPWWLRLVGASAVNAQRPYTAPGLAAVASVCGRLS